MIDLERSASELRQELLALAEAEKCARMEEDFDSLVAKLMKKGHSKEYATSIAGKVAKEKGKVKGYSGGGS